MMAQVTRSFVDKLDFVTSIGHGSGGDSRARLGVTTKGADQGRSPIWRVRAGRRDQEMAVVSLHPGVTRAQIAENSGWPVKFAAQVAETPAPTVRELEVLRDLHARTKRAHAAADDSEKGWRKMRDAFICDCSAHPDRALRRRARASCAPTTWPRRRSRR